MVHFVQRIAQKPVPVGLLGAAAEAISGLAERDRKNPTRRVVAILSAIDAHKVPCVRRSDFSRAIQFRLQALAQLQDQLAYPASSKTKDIHDAFIEAAASMPLIIKDGVASFEAQSFFQRVLTISEARDAG
jgi:hypothetical protein